MNKTAVVLAASLASGAGAFELETEGDVVPLHFAAVGDVVHIALQTDSGVVLDTRNMETGDSIRALNLWSRDGSPTLPKFVRLLADEDAVTAFVSGSKTYALRIGAEGTHPRTRMVSDTNPEVGRLPIGGHALQGVARRGDTYMAVFQRSVVALNADFEELAHWKSDNSIGAFAEHGDTLWIAEHDREAATLRGFSIDDLSEHTAVAVPDLDGPPRIVAFSDEVLLFAGNRDSDSWRRCSHRVGTSRVACTDFVPDTRSHSARYGTLLAAVFRVGDGYVLSMPDICGVGARSYDRNHEASHLQPVRTSNGLWVGGALGVVADRLAALGLKPDFARGGPSSPAYRVVFDRYRYGPSEPANPEPWESSCPAWYDADFFAGATPEQVTACVEAGADPNGPGPCGDGATSPLSLATTMAEDPEVVRALIDAGADPNRTTIYGITALHQAVTSRNPRMMSVLIERGADVNARDDDGMTPLHYFAQHGQRNRAVLDKLLNAGADRSIGDRHGYLPVDYADDDTVVAMLTKDDLPPGVAAEIDRMLTIEDAVRHVASTRQAVKNFAGDDEICCGDDTANLTTWFQMRGFLAGDLRDRAKADGHSDTLASSNPWGGDYVLIVDVSSPRHFTLRITGVDLDAIDTLKDELGDGSEVVVDGDTLEATYRI